MWAVRGDVQERVRPLLLLVAASAIAIPAVAGCGGSTGASSAAHPAEVRITHVHVAGSGYAVEGSYSYVRVDHGPDRGEDDLSRLRRELTSNVDHAVGSRCDVESSSFVFPPGPGGFGAGGASASGGGAPKRLG